MTDAGRILLLENIHPDARANLEAEGFEVELLKKALPEDELCERIKGVVAVGLRSKTTITPKVLAAADRLRAIGAFCIGTNQIALDEANRRGIPAFNAPFSNTRSVAEMMMCEIVMLARRFGDRNNEMHRGVWTKSAEGSREIRGKTLGIVGYGHIGRQVGVLAEAFGMNVLFFDVSARLPMGNNRAAQSLEELLEKSDFVTLHVPETPSTKDMIGQKQIALMKKGAYLINASRGTVVDIPALAEGIKTGHLGGAAIDVFPVEPEGNDGRFVSELQSLPNVVLTPHIGGSTAEAQVAIGHEVSNTLIRFLKYGATNGAVNFPNAELPKRDGVHRFTHVHRNVPGVLRDVNRIVSEASANVVGQVLATDANIGYLVMDVSEETARRVGEELCQRMAELPTTISATLLY
ncbi:phosphoglycerate dehydrogenase [Sandaracinus amylolyticus]|uniref:D-3-phosphoglycerate dehydrogenase n=1 Tax=Sandaracinus amylolyticus TaxID=927083 RepID=A0A0F6SFA7_9BACT|nr:phosphoglycerate dehydrogenase [Sandaracinus amylolyticus]AKF06614.1 D-3-phosphoglycerate dehydrogenase [Sandaracinus amylolyticus]